MQMQWARFLRPRLTLRGVCLAILFISGLLAWQLQPVVREEFEVRSVDGPPIFLQGIVATSARSEAEATRRVVSSEIHLPFLGKRLRHGCTRVFAQDGRLLDETHWSRGRQHGKHLVWLSSGQLAIQGQWKQGQPHGSWLFWLEAPSEFKDNYPEATLADYYRALMATPASVQSEERHYESGKLISLTRYYLDSKHRIDFRYDTASQGDEEFVQVRHLMLDDELLWEENLKGPAHALVLHGLTVSHLENYAGHWHEGKPSGKWKWEGRNGDTHTITYQDGHIKTVDGQAVEAFTRYIRGVGSQLMLAECRRPLSSRVPISGHGMIQELRKHCNLLVHSSAIDVIEKEQDEIVRNEEERRSSLPEDPFAGPPVAPDSGVPEIPFDAALTILLQDKGLTVRFRSECLWIVSQAVAKEWQNNKDILRLEIPPELNRQLDATLDYLHPQSIQSLLGASPNQTGHAINRELFIVRGNGRFEIPYRFAAIKVRSLLEILKTEHDVETTFDGKNIVVTVPEVPRPSKQPPLIINPFGF